MFDACKILKDKGYSFVCEFVGGETAEIDAARFDKEVRSRGLNTIAVYQGRKYGEEKHEAFEHADMFIPAKEIVSIQDVILRSFDIDKAFGFDKSYVDLSRALSKTIQGRNYKEFSEARKQLNEAIGGRIEYDEDKKAWLFRDKERRIFEINIASEGIKRLAILDLLLGNHYLTRDSVVIIDEAEANLHPEMIRHFMEINDLLDGMPENPIIQESINIYEGRNYAIMAAFKESGMTFDFADDSFYHIEKSLLYSQMEGYATCECIVMLQDKVTLLEAKSSTPNPRNKEDFDNFICDIVAKFRDTMSFYHAVILRHDEKDIGTKIKSVSL